MEDKRCKVCSSSITKGYLSFGDFCGHSVCLRCLSKNAWSMCNLCNKSLFILNTQTKPPPLSADMSFEELEDIYHKTKAYLAAEESRLENIRMFAYNIVNVVNKCKYDVYCMNSKLEHARIDIFIEKWQDEYKWKYVNPGLTNEICVSVKRRDDLLVVNHIRLRKFEKEFKINQKNFDKCTVKFDAADNSLKTVKQGSVFESCNTFSGKGKLVEIINTKKEDYKQEIEQMRIHDNSAITEISILNVPSNKNGLFNGLITCNYSTFDCIAIKTQNQNLHLIYLDEMVTGTSANTTRYIGFVPNIKESIDNIMITMTDDFYMSCDLRKFSLIEHESPTFRQSNRI